MTAILDKELQGTLDRWNRGEALRTKHVNGPIDAINRQQSIQPPRQVFPTLGTGNGTTTTAQFKITAINDDTITAQKFDGLNAMTSVTIAKPWLLRRTPFDGKTRNGITYTYSSATLRVATDGAANETQLITPIYVVGDIIYASNGIIGGTSLADVTWLEDNRDARAWAQIAEP